jgi:predicted peptidase
MQSHEKLFTADVASSLPYLLYLPDDYASNDNKQWPLIFFLHGAGERGSYLQGVRAEGIPARLEQGDDLPFIVLAPQCPQMDWWANYTEILIMLLDTITEAYNVDETRLYLTGLSMGGFGTWHLATEYPQRFAAIAPVCGFGFSLIGYPERLKRITHLPTWTFHGDADDVVDISETEQLVAALRQYGGNVNFTVYPGVKHDSWTQTYANPKLYKWFLQHTT